MKKHIKTLLLYFFTIILSICLGGFITVFLLNHLGVLGNVSDSEEVVSAVVNKDVTITEADSINESIQKVYDSVVVVEVYNKNGVKVSSGSGFVYKNTDKGYIITNYHVIEGGSTVTVTDSSSNEINATILGGDSYSDIAVLSIPSDTVLGVADIGDSSVLTLGDTLFTVGSPLGSKYIGTVTKGILSGVNRKVTVALTNGNFVMEVLQTDAAINPGNSGGPLLNINGEVIGVTSMKLVEDQIEGMGFAIPIEIAMSTASKLELGQSIERPLFGVSIIDIDNAYVLRRYNINSYDVTEGVAIVKIQDNSPASRAGFKTGDIITAINDDETIDTAHFNYILYKYDVGSKVNVTYYRDGKKNNVEVTLDVKLSS